MRASKVSKLKTSPEVELMETFICKTGLWVHLKTSPEVELMETGLLSDSLRLTLLKTSPEVELMETKLQCADTTRHSYRSRLLPKSN